MALTAWHRIKAKQPASFRRARVFRKAIAVLESHHFRLLMCRYVIDLFDKRVLRQVVLEEDEEEEETSSSDTDEEEGFGKEEAAVP